MNSPTHYRLPRLSIVDLDGKDATQILHNLTTNDVRGLKVGQSCESFVTDVRGKVLHHVLIAATATGFRLIGPDGIAKSKNDDEPPISYSERFVAHCDRYTIREDAVPTIRDEDYQVM
ncbi:MAG: hypothetical protein AAF989_14430, partial [Planctomycetota bacterium]